MQKWVMELALARQKAHVKMCTQLASRTLTPPPQPPQPHPPPHNKAICCDVYMSLGY
jgi:hypothetical protein